MKSEKVTLKMLGKVLDDVSYLQNAIDQHAIVTITNAKGNIISAN